MGYKVTDTQRMTSMTPAGGTVQSYRVWLVTDRGATGQVDVPVDQWNADDLPGVLQAEAAKLDLAYTVSG